jgi:hypothetical protein
MMLLAVYAQASVAEDLRRAKMDYASELGPSYVLMVSSMHPPFLALNEENVKAFNATPFDGIAVDVIGPYDGSKLPHEPTLLTHCEPIRFASSKTIWPRVYLNRILELSDKLRARNVTRNPTYFGAIRGMDIFDEAGTLTDYYSIYRLSLRMARALSAPGIVLDLEAYNHPDGYRVEWIAKRQGKSPAAVIVRLKEIGAQMAGITNEEFPGAVLWSLFTAFERPEEYREKSGSYYPSPSYIAMGLLAHAAGKNVPVTLISGGEWGGYYYASVEAMRKRFADRNAAFQPWLEKYPNHLALGGTITVWGDARNNTGWVLKDATASTPYRRVLDFEPLVAEMRRTYRYIWFYVPSVTDYKPLNAEASRETNAQIAELLRRTWPRGADER